MRITDTHVYFWDGYLSNWHQLVNPIRYSGYEFFNSEQLFMYLKATHFRDFKIAKQIVEFGANPKTAKELGRMVYGFNNPEWDAHKINCMNFSVKLKFKNNEDIRQQLLDTGERTLVEASPTDSVWGIGLHWSDDKVLDENNWAGQNLLGKCLMKVRNELK